MMNLAKPQPHEGNSHWRRQLDDFVKENQQSLAALSWAFSLQSPDSSEILGIDCSPTPHFVACPTAAIAKLNEQVGDQLRELMGVVEGYKPEEEVLIIGIGQGEIKVINYQPSPLPPTCFETVNLDAESLMNQLEAHLVKQFSA